MIRPVPSTPRTPWNSNRESEVNDIKLQRLWRSFSKCTWTQPVIVRSPFGILAAIDLLAISTVLFVVVCFTTNLTVPRSYNINLGEEISGFEKRWQAKLDKSEELFGKAIAFLMRLFFIPVSRGSPILRLIGPRRRYKPASFAATASARTSVANVTELR